MANKTQDRLTRIQNANALIELIASTGRHFFCGTEDIGRFDLDGRNRLRYRDPWNGAMIYPASNGWRKFSEGGTMRAVIETLAHHINTGYVTPSNIFGPWPSWISEGDPWGYGADMDGVREKARELGILAKEMA
jgi:hypothetical protein